MSVEVYFLKVFSNKYEDDEINAQTKTLILKKKVILFSFKRYFNLSCYHCWHLRLLKQNPINAKVSSRIYHESEVSIQMS